MVASADTPPPPQDHDAVATSAYHPPSRSHSLPPPASHLPPAAQPAVPASSHSPGIAAHPSSAASSNAAAAPAAHRRRSYFAWASLDPFVAGLTAGTVTTLCLHPFDLLKTRLQVGVTPSATAVASASAAVAPPRHYRGSLHAARVLLREEGWHALYKGLSPNLVGNAVAWGAYFCGFELVKRTMSERESLMVVRWISHPTHLPSPPVSASHDGRSRSSSAASSARTRQLNALEHILAASLTGVVVSAATNPIWVVKTRMFLDRTPGTGSAAIPGTAVTPHPSFPSLTADVSRSAGSSGTLWRALKDLYRAEGILGFYRGFVPGLFGVSHGALQFMCYEELKRMRMEQRGRSAAAAAAAAAGAKRRGAAGDSALSAVAAAAVPPTQLQWTAWETISMSALSKAFASFVTYPYQTVRSKLQMGVTGGSGDAPKLRHVVKELWREEGVRGFYRGSVLNLLRVLPAACSVFLVYEQVGGYMRRHARYEQE